MLLAPDVVTIYLGLLMWNQSHEDAFLGMTVCGLLVRNRVLAGWHGQDWIANMREYDKYSANPPKEPKPWTLGDPIRDDKFRRCLGIASSIYSGHEKDITCGGLRCCKLNECSDEFKEKIIRPVDPTGQPVHARVAQVGQLAIFK